MTQKSLSKWLKGIIVSLALCGLIVYAGLLPLVFGDLQAEYPEFASAFRIWMPFLVLTAVPCYLVLLAGWKIAANIGKDRSFSSENAVLLQRISAYLAADAAYFFVGNVILFLLNWNHPATLLLSCLVDFACVIAAIVAACLSHLVRKAADLQEQSDLTI